MLINTSSWSWGSIIVSDIWLSNDLMWPLLTHKRRPTFTKIWLWRHQLLTWLNRKLTRTPSVCNQCMPTLALLRGHSVSTGQFAYWQWHIATPCYTCRKDSWQNQDVSQKWWHHITCMCKFYAQCARPFNKSDWSIMNFGWELWIRRFQRECCVCWGVSLFVCCLLFVFFLFFCFCFLGEGVICWLNKQWIPAVLEIHEIMYLVMSGGGGGGGGNGICFP